MSLLNENYVYPRFFQIRECAEYGSLGNPHQQSQISLPTVTQLPCWQPLELPCQRSPNCRADSHPNCRANGHPIAVL